MQDFQGNSDFQPSILLWDGRFKNLKFKPTFSMQLRFPLQIEREGIKGIGGTDGYIPVISEITLKALCFGPYTSWEAFSIVFLHVQQLDYLFKDICIVSGLGS